MKPATKSQVRELLEADREVHFYGLGDLADAFWNRSRWWVRNGVAIGEIGLSDDPADITVYGINTGNPDEAFSLWADVDTELPDRYFATGVSGFADVLAANGRTVESDLGPHTKMILANPNALQTQASPHSTRPLNQDDLAAIGDLHQADPVESAFFSPALLDVGPYVGVFEGERLVAMAGVHVCDDEFGVAAVGGVLTRNDYRGQGLATATTAAVSRALIERGIKTIGLNVMSSNSAARRIYTQLGYQDIHTYQEALVARPGT